MASTGIQLSCPDLQVSQLLPVAEMVTVVSFTMVKAVEEQGRQQSLNLDLVLIPFFASFSFLFCIKAMIPLFPMYITPFRVTKAHEYVPVDLVLRHW